MAINGEASVEDRARNLGWVPLEEFRGDPDRFVSAEEFVEKGESLLPILKANNRELQGKLTDLQSEVARMRTLYEASQDAIEALREHQSEETKRQVEKARKDLVEELRAAREEGNLEREVEINSEITRIDSAKEETKGTPAPRQAAAESNPAESPDFVAWKKDNPWFDTDEMMTAAAVATGRKLRMQGNKLEGRAFFDEVGKQVRMRFEGTQQRTSKVEPSGGGNSAGGGGDGGGGSKYSDLPAEAKQACERQALRLVGEGRAFKTKDAWRAHYAKIYFESEGR